MTRPHRITERRRRHDATTYGTMHWFGETAIIDDITLADGSTLYSATFSIGSTGTFQPGDLITIHAPDGSVVVEHRFGGPEPLAVRPGDQVAMTLTIRGRQ